MPLSKEEEKKVKSLSERVANLKKYKSTPSAKTPSLSVLNDKYNPIPKVEIKYEPVEHTVAKLNALEGAIESKVIKDLPTKEDFVSYVKNLKGNDRIDISNIRNGNFNMSDQRWHGGGGTSSGITGLISAGTNVTITGSGTSGDPYVISSSGGGGSGTVTSVSVVTANGISGSVATATTTPAITLTLGAITPSAIQVSGLTASQITATDGSKNLVSLDTATYPSLTELSYVKGVTSSIQTQINAKGTVSSIATGTGLTGGTITSTGTIAFTTALAPIATLAGNSLKYLRVNVGETAVEYATNPLGDVVGPSSSTDNAIARFDSTTGKLIQNSGLILGDAGAANALFDISAIATSDKTFTFPNTSGTLMLIPAVPANYTVTNVTTDRTYNADATTIDELADVLGTLIDDLTTLGLLQ